MFIFKVCPMLRRDVACSSCLPAAHRSCSLFTVMQAWFCRPGFRALAWILIVLGFQGSLGIRSLWGFETADSAISRIAFGSCADQAKPCPVWGTLADYQPDLLLLLGDTVYADIENGRVIESSPEKIAAAYDRLASQADFARLRKSSRLMAIWDDHDYGKNDSGSEWKHKEASTKIFHDFLGTPQDSPRRSQAGVYHAEMFGPAEKRVQVIMLDTRYFRSQLEQSDQSLPGFRARPYVPQTGPDATLLGETQWKWLEEQLRKPAALRILASSIQVISDEHPFEMWANFPDERNRLYQLIRDTQANGVVFISGDRHLGDISLDNTAVGYPLFDVTASGLNQASSNWRPLEPNSRRVAGLQFGNHFGSIEIDWQLPDPMLKLQLRLEDGQIGVQTLVPLSRLATWRDPELPEGITGPAKALTLPEGTQLVLQFRVVAGREFSDTGRLLLNSQENHRSPENFTVVVNPSALSGQFQNAKLEQFKGKQIRAEGQISIYRGQKQLVVDSAEQLQMVE